MNKILGSLLLLLLAASSCSSSKKESEAREGQPAAERQYQLSFDTDSAHKYIRRQVEFGPRVPGTEAHAKCEQYILRKMRQYGADTIIEQKAEVTAFNGDILPINNILARFNTSAPRRILLAAHYDSRPWADQESNEKDRNKPIAGANDGASGVGVIIELARAISQSDSPIGVDFLFVDAEDYGNSDGWGFNEDSWCLGTQYWAEYNPYTSSDRPEYGIVLDMVGGTNARFHREAFSMKNAKPIVDKVWATAQNAGFSNVFIDEVGGSIIDDHIYINKAGIPCIDIVECNNAITGTFPPTWHTHNDNMAAIDPNSLNAVGTTVLRVIEGM